MITLISNYFNQALAELHQVRWPTRQQAVRLSIIVIIFVAISSVAFGVVDYALAQAVAFLLSLTY